RPRQPLRHGPAGAHQPVALAGDARARLLLRPRSLEPDGLVHRGQCLDQCRRPALPEIRHHRQSRARARSGNGRGRGAAGGRQAPPGYDLAGALVGGEGTLGLLTAITVRLLHVPAGVKTLLASFSAIDDASETVSAIVAAGIIPAALEMIDETFVRAINEGVGAGYPKGAGAVLLIELDGPTAEIEAQAVRIVQICRDHAALEIRVARDEADRALLWKGRKEAAGAVGRMSPSWILQDAVVPRS